MILEFLGLKKPAFWRLFSEMTANFVSLVFEKSARYILGAYDVKEFTVPPSRKLA